MDWPMHWMEALGVLAVVFAAGNGLGFALSWMMQPPAKRTSRPSVKRKKAPDKNTARKDPSPVAPVEIERAPAPAPEVVVAPSPPPPAATMASFSLRVRYPVSPFGKLSFTRPDPGQPSS